MNRYVYLVKGSWGQVELLGIKAEIDGYGGLDIVGYPNELGRAETVGSYRPREWVSYTLSLIK
jgi:hypothetical protein